LSFQTDDNRAAFPQSQSIDFLGPITSGPPPSQPPPPLPATRPVCEQLPISSGAILPTLPSTVLPPQTTTTTTVLPTTPLPEKAVINSVPFDTTDSLKTHARKGSSSKKSIEYQLLEEDPAPISPPRNTPITSTDAFGLPVFVPPPPPTTVTRTGPSLSDPFDIQWSTEVLKGTTTVTAASNGLLNNGGTHSPAVSNPFTSESAPVNV
jgi:hypothetical protein